ncbi:hypothetical protein [Thiocystis violacea]|uniref:hypothetical protein n=1 Tax=Thiocystis violacea TaxID=13725 RepID=UPI001902ED02|nr:hypothetical protein [Thiocystis violacea]MBK1718146.1 hypothetical protein [Thiocystis violacea]
MTESPLGPLLNECEREPLASSGLIQDEGMLLHVDRESGLIDSASDNAAAFIGDRTFCRMSVICQAPPADVCC